MKAANALGLAAEGIHGNMTTKEVMERNAELYEGKIRIMYVFIHGLNTTYPFIASSVLTASHLL